MIWLGGVGHEYAGCSVRCGRGMRHSGTLAAGMRYRALVGWGLWVECSVSAFRGDTGVSAGGEFCGLPTLPDFYLTL